MILLMSKKSCLRRRVTFMVGFIAAIILATPAKAGFRFVAWGDATDLLEFVVTNSAQIRQLDVRPAFNIFVGDLYDTGFSPEAVAALNNAMNPPGDTSLSGTLFPVRGNHDILGVTN